MKRFFTKLCVLMMAFSLLAPLWGSLPTAQAADKKDGPLKVALLIGNRGDMSFFDSAVAGMEKAEKEFGKKIDVKIIEHGDDPSGFEPNFLDAADSGVDVVIVSSTLSEFVTKYAPDYPDVEFWIFDTEFDFSKGDYPNVYSIVYKANEASFLGGYLVAAQSKSGVIGFLGGIDQNIISDFLVGFIQGAKEAKPDIKVATSYVGSWTDSAKGKELGIAMYNQGADIVFNVAGGSGVGLIEAAVENKKQVLGVDSDQAMMYKAQGKEDFAKVIPTSVLKNVGDSLHRAIGLRLEGKLKLGANEELGIKEGSVGLADNEYFQAAYPEDLRAKVKELEDKIIKGEIKVDSGYGMPTEKVKEIRDGVKP
ncbi:BMP family ABC transporter substrate-binding protein [Vaginisenegalia massiliensis]|uniref:BMP family ABC transporter substrate-binding protein n=1 Tax=Vaginisenegalia massiliensis TaxID=2058294 RepID=UPI000F52D0BA|nr:BMP family ABC transporter substrate-binding protein [Vaginisenegalia massiliensis]